MYQFGRGYPVCAPLKWLSIYRRQCSLQSQHISTVAKDGVTVCVMQRWWHTVLYQFSSILKMMVLCAVTTCIHQKAVAPCEITIWINNLRMGLMNVVAVCTYLSDDNEAWVCRELCPFKTICINLKMVALSAVIICINLKMGVMCIQNISQSKDDGTMDDHNMYGTNLKLIALSAVTMYQSNDGATCAVTICINLKMVPPCGSQYVSILRWYRRLLSQYICTSQKMIAQCAVTASSKGDDAVCGYNMYVSV